MGAGCIRLRMLSSRHVTHERDHTSDANHVNPEVANPQPSTSGVNGAVVHAGSKGRDNFLRPDLQTENLMTSSDSDADFANVKEQKNAGLDDDGDVADDDDDAERYKYNQRMKGVLFVRTFSMHAPEVDSDDAHSATYRDTGSGGHQNRKCVNQRQCGDTGSGRNWDSRARDGRSEGGAGAVTSPPRHHQVAPEQRDDQHSLASASLPPSPSVPSHMTAEVRDVMSPRDYCIQHGDRREFHLNVYGDGDSLHKRAPLYDAPSRGRSITQNNYATLQDNNSDMTHDVNSAKNNHHSNNQKWNRKVKAADETHCRESIDIYQDQFSDNNEIMEDLIEPESSRGLATKAPPIYEYNNRKRDFFSSMSIPSENCSQSLILRDDHLLPQKHSSLLWSELVEPSEEASSYTDEFQMKAMLASDSLGEQWSTSLLPTSVSDRAFSSASSRQYNFSSATDRYRGDSSSKSSPHKPCSPDMDQLYPCFEEEPPIPTERHHQQCHPTTISQHSDNTKTTNGHLLRKTSPNIFQFPDVKFTRKAKDHNRVRSVNPLPSSTAHPSPIGGPNVSSKLAFEYSVFSDSCDASEVDLSDVMTLCSSGQESIESDFPIFPSSASLTEFSCSPKSEIIHWDTTNVDDKLGVELPPVYAMDKMRIAATTSSNTADITFDKVKMSMGGARWDAGRNAESTTINGDCNGRNANRARMNVGDTGRNAESVAINQVGNGRNAIRVAMNVGDTGRNAKSATINQDGNGKNANRTAMNAVDAGRNTESATINQDGNGKNANMAAIHVDEAGRNAESATIPGDDNGRNAHRTAVNVSVAGRTTEIATTNVDGNGRNAKRAAVNPGDAGINIKTPLINKGEAGKDSESEAMPDCHQVYKQASIGITASIPAISTAFTATSSPAPITTRAGLKAIKVGITQVPTDECSTSRHTEAEHGENAGSATSGMIMRNKHPVPTTRQSREKATIRKADSQKLQLQISSGVTGEIAPQSLKPTGNTLKKNKVETGGKVNECKEWKGWTELKRGKEVKRRKEGKGQKEGMEWKKGKEDKKGKNDGYVGSTSIQQRKMTKGSTRNTTSASIVQDKISEPNRLKPESIIASPPSGVEVGRIESISYGSPGRHDLTPQKVHYCKEIRPHQARPLFSAVGNRDPKQRHDRQGCESKQVRSTAISGWASYSNTSPSGGRRRLPEDPGHRHHHMERYVKVASKPVKQQPQSSGKIRVSPKWTFVVHDSSKDSDADSYTTVMELPISKDVSKRCKAPAKPSKKGSDSALKMDNPGNDRCSELRSTAEKSLSDRTRLDGGELRRDHPDANLTISGKIVPGIEPKAVIEMAEFRSDSTNNLSGCIPGMNHRSGVELATKQALSTIGSLARTPFESIRNSRLQFPAEANLSAASMNVVSKQRQSVESRGNLQSANTFLDSTASSHYNPLEEMVQPQSSISMRSNYQSGQNLSSHLLKTPISVFAPSYNSVIGQQRALHTASDSEWCVSSSQSARMPGYRKPLLAMSSSMGSRNGCEPKPVAQAVDVGEQYSSRAPTSGNIQTYFTTEPFTGRLQRHTSASDVDILKEHYATSSAVSMDSLAPAVTLEKQHCSTQVRKTPVAEGTRSMTDGSWAAGAAEVAGALGPSRCIPVSNLNMPQRFSQGPMISESSRVARVDMAVSQFTTPDDIMHRTSHALPPHVLDGHYSVPTSGLSGYHHTATCAPFPYLPAHQHIAHALSIPGQSGSPHQRHHHSLVATLKHQNPLLEVNMPMEEHVMRLNVKEDTASSAPLGMIRLQNPASTSTPTYRQQYRTTSLAPMQGLQPTRMAGQEQSYPLASYPGFYQSRSELLPQLVDSQHQSGLSQVELRQFEVSSNVPYPIDRKDLSRINGSAAPQSSISLPDPLRMRSSVIGLSKQTPTNLTQFHSPPYMAVHKSPCGEQPAMQAHPEKSLRIPNSSQPQQTIYTTGPRFNLLPPNESKVPSPSEFQTIQRAQYEKEAIQHHRLTTNADLIPIQTIAEQDQTITKQSHKRSKILVPGKRIKASYLTAQGERVVILEPGIGANATLDEFPWQPQNGKWRGETQQSGESQMKPQLNPYMKPHMKTTLIASATTRKGYTHTN